MPTMLNQKPSAIDDLVEANIKRVLAGRRLEFFGADPGTRERLLLSWRPRCGGDGAGGVMFLCFQNRARLAKSDRPTAPAPPPPLSVLWQMGLLTSPLPVCREETAGNASVRAYDRTMGVLG